MDNNELYHFGIKGMKWGIRRTPIQLGHRTKKGSKLIKSGRDANSRHSQEQRKAKIEKKKREVLKSRSAKELYKYANLFNTRELQEAYNRLQLERNIQNLVPKEVKQGQNFTQKIIKSGRTVSDLLDTGTKLYNNVAKIYNSTENGRTNPVPLINGDGNKQKNKK